MRREAFAVKLTVAEFERLDELALEAGLSRADTMRSLLAGVEAVPRRSIPDRAELLELLGEGARAGGVRANELLMRELRLDAAAAKVEPEAPPLSRIDELATRRAVA